MAIQFPANPTIGQTYTSANGTWSWTGVKWRLVLVANSSAVNSHIIPAHNEIYDLGHSTLRWRDLYLSGNTLNLGNTAISSSGNTVSLSSSANANAAVSLTVSTLQLGTGANSVTLIPTATGIQQSVAGTVTSAMGATGATGPAGTSASILVREEGSLITSSVTELNFIGNAITATASGGAVTITVTAQQGGTALNADGGIPSSQYGGISVLDGGTIV